MSPFVGTTDESFNCLIGRVYFLSRKPCCRAVALSMSCSRAFTVRGGFRSRGGDEDSLGKGVLRRSAVGGEKQGRLCVEGEHTVSILCGWWVKRREGGFPSRSKPVSRMLYYSSIKKRGNHRQLLSIQSPHTCFSVRRLSSSSILLPIARKARASSGIIRVWSVTTSPCAPAARKGNIKHILRVYTPSHSQVWSLILYC